MKKQKPDLISDSEFTKINLPKAKHHFSLPSEVIPEDENADSLEETLIGMEYDIESDEDLIGKEEIVPDEDSEYLKAEHRALSKDKVEKEEEDTY